MKRWLVVGILVYNLVFPAFVKQVYLSKYHFLDLSFMVLTTSYPFALAAFFLVPFFAAFTSS
jgi:hypothetical protein